MKTDYSPNLKALKTQDAGRKDSFNVFRRATRMKKQLLLSFVISLMIVLPAFAENDSTIHGLVMDPLNGTLPGVAVYLKKSGDSSELTAYTDTEGKVDFAGLSKGDYEVRAELDGFQTISAAITLEDTIVRSIEIVMPLLQTVEESMTVTAESPDVLSKETTMHSEVLDDQVFNYAPIASQRFQDTLPLIPGVVRGPDGLMNINGARATESALLVNGSNVTDPVTGNFAVELPIEAVENVEVSTNPYSAEFGKFTGGVTSISTRAGGEHLKVEFNDFMPRFHFNDGINGIEAFSPRFRVSGPTFKDNLYFSQAVQYKLTRTYLDDLPENANRIELEGFDSITQLDYRPSATHQMTFTASAFPEKEENYHLNTFLPEESTPDLEQDGYNIALSDRRFFENSSYMESTVNYKIYNVSVSPKGDLSDPFDATIEGYRNNFFNYQNRDSTRIQLTNAYTFRPLDFSGSHVIRTGVEFAHTSYSATVKYSPVEVHGEENRLLERDDFIDGGNIGHSNNEITTYIQDLWTLRDSLNVEWGLRMDYDTVGGHANLGPRIAVSYAPAALPKTVFKTGFGVFYDKVYLNSADFEEYPSRRIVTYDDAGNVIASRLLVNRIAGDIKAPRSMAWNLEVDQQMGSNFLLRSNIKVRKGTNQFLVTPTEDSLLLNNEGQSKYWEWEFTARYRIANDSNLYASYVRSSTKGNLNDFDSYFGNFQRPLIREDAYAALSFDAPNRFLFWGVVKAPGKVYVSPLLEIRNGFPYSVIDQAQQYVGKRNSERFPVFHSLDLRITRTFKLLSKYQLTAGIKIFNVLNHFNPRDVQNNIDSPAFGTFYNGVGRTYRAAFEIQY